MGSGGQNSKGKRPMEMESDQVRLCFKSQDGCRDYYKVSDNFKMQDLLQAYCRKRQIEYRAVVFLHDGKRLRRRGTINQVGLEDQAEIDVMINQNGGGRLENVI